MSEPRSRARRLSLRALAPMLLMFLLTSLVTVAPVAAQSAAMSYVVTSDWGSGFQASVTLSNSGTAAIVGYQLEFDFGATITSAWDGNIVALGGGRYGFSGASWSQDIPAGASVSFGFVATPNGPAADPLNAALNGMPIPVNGVPSGAAPGGGGGGSAGGNPPTGPTNPMAPTTAAVGSGKRIVGYFTAWSVYGRNYHVADIPADKITHINYAFANLSNGQVVLGDPYADVDRFYPGDSWAAGSLRGNFNQLSILKSQHPHLKTLISIGGWTWSSAFSQAAATPASRTIFATSAVQFMKQYGFDGIDVDWEYPVSGGLAGNVTSPNDKQNYTSLLAEIRAQLNALEQIDGRHYLLTIAAPAGPAVHANLEISLIHPYLDWINVMAYDFHGSWSSLTGHNSALFAQPGDPNPDPVVATQFNSHSAMQAYQAAGVPPHKLVLGSGFYGRGWQGVANVNDGLYQPHGGIPAGTWEPGVFDYEDLALNYIGNGYTRHWDNFAKAPYLYNPSTGIMISYDDAQSLQERAAYVNQNGFGGIMVWELSGDDAADTLVTRLHDDLVKGRLYLDAHSSGGGLGDMRLQVDGIPAGSSHAIVLISATPAPAGPGSGGFAGIVYDGLTVWSLSQPSLPYDPLHFPVAHNPYEFGALWQGPGFAIGLAGQTWDFLAVSYLASPFAITAISPVSRINW